MEIFIINLDAALERRKFQDQQFKKLNLQYILVTATRVDDIDDETYRKHYYDWQRPLKRAEIACYFSHQKLWKKIIDKKPALILEDDALLSKYTPEILTRLEKYRGIDIVNLEVFARKKYVAKIGAELSNNHQLFRLYQDRAGAGAYVLYPSGAKKLLQHENKVGIALADAHIHNCHALNCYQIEPACAVQLMFCKKYGIEQQEMLISRSSIHNTNGKQKRVLIFRLKRIVTQLKLGAYQLSLIIKTKKRHITLNSRDFSSV